MKLTAIIFSLLSVTLALRFPVFPTRCEPFDEPIDFVYTWVNGSDPDFVDVVNSYRQVDELDVSFNNERQSNNRYADYDQIKYSIRSVEKFAPWVNHIYIVTNGQVPTWLNTNHPDISIVTHSQIWRYPEDLPNFNSEVIEQNLHRIEGLSDKFVYFNDDFGLIAETCPSDFYTEQDGYKLFTAPNFIQCSKTCPNEVLGNGVCDDECNQSTCAFDAGDCIDGQKISPKVDGIGSVHNANHLTTLLELTRLFGGVDRYKRPHEPIMINKNIIEEMQQQMMPIIANMSTHRFRDNYDMQFQFAYDNYVRDSWNKEKTDTYKFTNVYSSDGRKDAKINVDNTGEDSLKKTRRQIDKIFRALASPEGHSYLFMCVQDGINHDLENAVDFIRLIQDEFYKKLFPNTSQFEIESDFEFEDEVDTTTDEPININMFSFNGPSVRGHHDRFPELVLATMLGFIILFSIRFLLRRMGCIFQNI